MNTTDRDTEPMTLGDLDDWPTEKITRTGAHRRTAYGSMIGWALLTVLAGLALGGGAWFAATANTQAAPPTSPAVVGANPTGSSTQVGLIVIPTTGTTTRTVRTDARKAAAVAPQDTGTDTPTAQATPTPSDTTTTEQASTVLSTASSTAPTATSSSATPTPTPSTTPPPRPISTTTVPGYPTCIRVTYSDGNVDQICSPSGSPTS